MGGFTAGFLGCRGTREESTMERAEWRQQIKERPVFDTHTHLNQPKVPIPARNFWDIAHYFWFQQELWSVGEVFAQAPSTC